MLEVKGGTKAVTRFNKSFSKYAVARIELCDCPSAICASIFEYPNYIEAAKGMPPVGSTVMTSAGLGKVCFIQFLNNTVAVKFEDGKIKEFTKEEIEMVDADVNVDIEDNRLNNYSAASDDEKVDAKQLKQLEDDRNSSTGNV